MKDEQYTQLLKILREINEKLSILISLQKVSTKPPSLGDSEKQILKLCNGKNSVDDMMKITSKKRNNIEVTLNHLRKKGMIKSNTLNQKTVYFKI